MTDPTPDQAARTLNRPGHGAPAGQNYTDVLTQAADMIEGILGPRTHPDVAAVIQVVHGALATQRRQLAHRLRSEAIDAKYGTAKVPAAQQMTYPGGLRRAARIVEGGVR